jgi:hypothetical protein
VSYARALHRLRALTLAHNALSEVLESATEDMLNAAAAEATEPTVTRGASESGSRPRVTTGITQRRIRSVDIERYIREAWDRAQTDDAREKVRAMAISATASLDDEAARRVRLLTA